MNFLSNMFGNNNGNGSYGGIPSGTTIIIENKSIVIQGKLGEGGFATVYLGTYKNTKYAIKHCRCLSGEQIELIRQEIKTLERIGNNPNIVQYHGYTEIKKDPLLNGYFILMEYMPDSLMSYLKNRQNKHSPLKEKELWSLFLDICKGLSHLHNLNPPLAHRDMKIENILITYTNNNDNDDDNNYGHNNGDDDEDIDINFQKKNKKQLQLKICDFGSCVNGIPKICKEAMEMSFEQDLIDRYTTPNYRSPEMIDLYQRKPLSVKVDIWALGVIFYTLAFLQHPFPDGNKMQILDANFTIPERHSYSNLVIKLMKALLHRDPDKRPTASQLCSHIQDIIQGGQGTLFSHKERSRPANSFAVSSSSSSSSQKQKPKSLLPNKEKEDDPNWDNVFNDDNNNNNKYHEQKKDEPKSNKSIPSKNASGIVAPAASAPSRFHNKKNPSADLDLFFNSQNNVKNKPNQEVDFAEWNPFDDANGNANVNHNSNPRPFKNQEKPQIQNQNQNQNPKPNPNPNPKPNVKHNHVASDEMEGVPEHEHVEVEVEESAFQFDEKEKVKGIIFDDMLNFDKVAVSPNEKDNNNNNNNNNQLKDDQFFQNPNQNQNQNQNQNENIPEKPKPKPKSRHGAQPSLGGEQDLAALYKLQLGVMQSMGFTNQELNVVALRQAKGDVNLAIHFLVSQQ